MKKLIYSFLLGITFLGFWSCKEDINSDPKGLVNLILVDSPAVWDSVFVEILGAEIEYIVDGKSDGTLKTKFLPYAPGDKKIEVSALVGGEALLLGRDEFPVSKILKITVKLGDQHSLYLAEKKYNLDLADLSEMDVPLDFEMDIDQGFSYDIVLDFDLERSILVVDEDPLTVQLDPTFITYRGAGTGEIKGSLGPTTLKPAIYAIQDGDSLSTHPNSAGSFLFRLPIGTYSIYVDPKDELYQDTLINNVVVEKGVTQTLEKITLNPKP